MKDQVEGAGQTTSGDSGGTVANTEALQGTTPPELNDWLRSREANDLLQRRGAIRKIKRDEEGRRNIPFSIWRRSAFIRRYDLDAEMMLDEIDNELTRRHKLNQLSPHPPKPVRRFES